MQTADYVGTMWLVYYKHEWAKEQRPYFPNGSYKKKDSELLLEQFIRLFPDPQEKEIVPPGAAGTRPSLHYVWYLGRFSHLEFRVQCTYNRERWRETERRDQLPECVYYPATPIKLLCQSIAIV